MKNNLKTGLLALAFAASAFSPAAFAQTADDVDFGDDASTFANDGECDDPRFKGPGMTSTALLDSDLGHDATDCRNAYEAGDITLITPIDIRFGDDSSNWASDGECDDPRFTGEGMASSPELANLYRDASDCRTLLSEGKIEVLVTDFNPDLTEFEGLSLGDNSGRYPSDGQCDDPRFEGEGMAVTPHPADEGKDQYDCAAALQFGRLVVADTPAGEAVRVFDDIDFGNDKGVYAGDGECDDPRFVGRAMGAPDGQEPGGDRKDCLEAYQEGRIRAVTQSIFDGIDFGDDSSLYVNDGVCDDPRFEGEAMSSRPALSGIASDATDCAAAYQAGDVRAAKEKEIGGYLFAAGFFFGRDTSDYANDGACDDPGFSGETSGVDSASGMDRTDCYAAYQAGEVLGPEAVSMELPDTVK